MNFYRNKMQICGRNFNVVTINQEDGEVKKEVKAAKVEQIHHIHILDRSGSMSWSINNLVDQVQETLDLISKNDLVSIIWFSSEGDFKTLVKGATVSDALKAKLNELRSTRGCTCFSDPIREAKEVISDLKSLCPNISVTLFTDGCPVVSWSTEEEQKRCQTLIESFKSDILAFNTIGYGDYYNQDFMKSLSEISEYGIFTHSSNIEEYHKIFENNFERITESKTEKATIVTKATTIYLNRKFCKMVNGGMYLSRLDKNKNQFFLISEKEFVFEYNGETYKSSEIKEEANTSTITNFLYAYAYSLYYANKRRESLEVLAYIGDKFLIDSHMSSFTYGETAEHITKLSNALFNTSDRKKEGIVKNYIPSKNAFCVFDLLNIFASSDSFYLPFHAEAQKYKRIGKKTEDQNNLFRAYDDIVMASMGDLVFNKERCNLSIRIKIDGMVYFDKVESNNVGLQDRIESHIYRNHSIIKDGTLNFDHIVVMMPENIYDKIQEKKKILTIVDFGDKAKQKEVEKQYGQKYVCCIVNINKIPIINMQYNEDISAKNVFEYANELLNAECKQKVLNYYQKQFNLVALLLHRRKSESSKVRLLNRSNSLKCMVWNVRVLTREMKMLRRRTQIVILT